MSPQLVEALLLFAGVCVKGLSEPFAFAVFLLTLVGVLSLTSKSGCYPDGEAAPQLEVWSNFYSTNNGGFDVDPKDGYGKETRTVVP